MALMKCPECGRSFSDKAIACPNCGITMDVVQELLQQKKEMAAQEEESVKKAESIAADNEKKLSPKQIKKEKRKHAQGTVCLIISCMLSVLYLSFIIPYWMDQGLIARNILSTDYKSVTAYTFLIFSGQAKWILIHLACIACGALLNLLGILSARRFFVFLALASYIAALALLPAFYPFASGQIFFCLIGLIRLHLSLR